MILEKYPEIVPESFKFELVSNDALGTRLFINRHLTFFSLQRRSKDNHIWWYNNVALIAWSFSFLSKRILLRNTAFIAIHRNTSSHQNKLPNFRIVKYDRYKLLSQSDLKYFSVLAIQKSNDATKPVLPNPIIAILIRKPTVEFLWVKF